MVDFLRIVIYLSIYVGLVATTFYILSYLDYKKREKNFFSEEELPSVSVIIPAYNEEKSIGRTIESALKIDYPKKKFEIIVVNNNSIDKTYEIAKKYEGRGVRVYTEKKRGKGAALNLGISKAKGEIIFTMDADTFVKTQSVRKMVQYFTKPEVMAVTPTMLVHNPKGIWQRIQYMEYFLGIFLRKALATVGAIYVTPGAFSAYRKKFFDKYGGYDENNITEDLEISLRIQSKGYQIENSEEAPAYTVVPKDFNSLLIQRRRWYLGHIKNIWNYRKIFSKRYGDLGMFVIPIGLLSIFFAVFVALYASFKMLFDAINQVIFLKSFGFSLADYFNFNSLNLQRDIFLIFTNSTLLFLLLFVALSGFYLLWAKKRVGKSSGLIINLTLFYVFFATLFAFWWIVSIFYSVFKRNVKWK